jgi:hypothetical protein
MGASMWARYFSNATYRFARIRRFGDDLIGDPAKTELEGQFVDVQQSYGWNI